jgi:SAM-dependent methyltransferase
MVCELRRSPVEDHLYDAGFFDYISEGARTSADAAVGVLAPLLGPAASVLDIGCGQGIWTARFAEEPQVIEAVGVDGDYVDRNALVIPQEKFISHDLKTPLDLGRRFSLALSLEVGEHLPPDAGPVLVDSLVKHADIVAFSAAIPGQGGEHHINEVPLEVWRSAFARRGYVAFDFVRPRLAGRSDVEPWYRYNILLYINESVIPTLPEEVLASRLPDDAPIPEVAPLLWRLRCAAIRPLPRPAVDRLASAKHALVRAARATRPPA